MPDSTLFDALRDTPGTELDRGAYHQDAAAIRADPSVRGDSWKLERSQFFEEKGDPAWEAFLNGDWEAVFAVFESEREDISRQVARYAAQDVTLRRVRITELPVSPYLRWEMVSHRVFVESGFEIGVLDAQQVEVFEHTAPLPELVVYGRQIVYQVRYDQRWRPAGAKRVDDPALAAGLSDQISRLFRRSEPFLAFFDREIAPSLRQDPETAGFDRR